MAAVNLYYYLFLTLIFCSVFLVAKEIISQRAEIFLRLPQDVMGVSGKQKGGSLLKVLKMLEPVSAKLLPYIKQDRTKKALISAGSAMSVPEFVSLKLLSCLFGTICASIIFAHKPMLVFPLMLIGFYYPDFWLKKKIGQRHRKIARDLPTVIDLLQLCVNAGMDFMLAVNRVATDFKPSALRDELIELWHECQVGRSRNQALKNLASRVNLTEISSFVRVLIQADKMGSPMGEVLAMHAEDLRVRRFQRGESMAFKAPIKLLFPLVVFIMPVVLVIVGGPVLLQFMQGAGGF